MMHMIPPVMWRQERLLVPESIFEKYEKIKHFFENEDCSLRIFEHLHGININNLEILKLERAVLVAGIKFYLEKNDCELSETTLERLNIHGVTENELIAAPNLRCYNTYTIARLMLQTRGIGAYPVIAPAEVESHIITAILTHTMPCIQSEPNRYLNILLRCELSKEAAKFLAQVILQEPDLILRIQSYYVHGYVFKEITESNIIESLKLKPEITPELKEYHVFKLFNVENLEGLFNILLIKLSQRARKKEDEFLLEAAVDVLQQTGEIAKALIIKIDKGNNTKDIELNRDINQEVLKYLPAQGIISTIKMAIESVNLTNNQPGSSHEPRQLTHQMSTLGLEDQESSRGNSNRLSVEPLMDGSVKIVAETRQFS